jgi:phage FluMu protein Com
MKKFLKNPWVLGIGTTVIGGVLLTFVNDWIKGVDLLSTLNTVVDCIVKAIVAFLNFELKVWWVLAAIALIVIALIVISKVLNARETNQSIPFLNYTKDYVLDFSWEWEYKEISDGKYSITNLRPVCSHCGMMLRKGYTIYGSEMKCLRCNTTNKWEDYYLTDAQMLIEDNIKKNYLQNQ